VGCGVCLRSGIQTSDVVTHNDNAEVEHVGRLCYRTEHLTGEFMVYISDSTSSIKVCKGCNQGNRALAQRELEKIIIEEWGESDHEKQCIELGIG